MCSCSIGAILRLLLCTDKYLMQETEISEMLLKNTELNIINSDLQKQLDELGKVRVLLPSNFYALAIL